MLKYHYHSWNMMEPEFLHKKYIKSLGQDKKLLTCP
jgi:hypothetical protein